MNLFDQRNPTAVFVTRLYGLSGNLSAIALATAEALAEEDGVGGEGA